MLEREFFEKCCDQKSTTPKIVTKLLNLQRSSPVFLNHWSAKAPKWRLFATNS